MKWLNLKQNKCPKCNKDIAGAYKLSTRMFECPCGFRITERKFMHITQEMVAADINKMDLDEKEGDNL